MIKQKKKAKGGQENEKNSEKCKMIKVLILVVYAFNAEHIVNVTCPSGTYNYERCEWIKQSAPITSMTNATQAYRGWNFFIENKVLSVVSKSTGD